MPNKYSIKLLPEAEEDLENIFRYISDELHNKPAADNLADKFYKAFERICKFPKSCPEGQTERKYRKLIVDSYIAFYWIDERYERIIVFRVFYGMMDYDKYL